MRNVIKFIREYFYSLNQPISVLVIKTSCLKCTKEWSRKTRISFRFLISRHCLRREQWNERFCLTSKRSEERKKKKNRKIFQFIGFLVFRPCVCRSGKSRGILHGISLYNYEFVFPRSRWNSNISIKEVFPVAMPAYLLSLIFFLFCLFNNSLHVSIFLFSSRFECVAYYYRLRTN